MNSILKQLFSSKNPRFNSAKYWEERYRTGGNSGTGSYNEIAMFKATVINKLLKEYRIEGVTEFGCGDGNQLSLLEMPKYIGLDVSNSIIQFCIEKFESDKNKNFFLYNTKSFLDNHGVFKNDCAMSIDVLFHLVEADIYQKYLHHVFETADRIVIIYAADFELPQRSPHELYRSFTKYINSEFPDWRLDKFIKNDYPSATYDDEKGSLADFFVYRRIKD